MKRFIALFLLLCSMLYADIDEYKVDLYYANGIMMQDDEEAVHLVPNEDVWNEYIFINSINIHSYAGAWERDLNMNLYI